MKSKGLKRDLPYINHNGILQDFLFDESITKFSIVPKLLAVLVAVHNYSIP